MKNEKYKWIKEETAGNVEWFLSNYCFLNY